VKLSNDGRQIYKKFRTQARPGISIREGLILLVGTGCGASGKVGAAGLCRCGWERTLERAFSLTLTLSQREQDLYDLCGVEKIPSP